MKRNKKIGTYCFAGLSQIDTQAIRVDTVVRNQFTKSRKDCRGMNEEEPGLSNVTDSVVLDAVFNAN